MGHFIDRTFHRWDISQTGHFTDGTFHRQDILQMGNFIDRTLHQRYYIRYFLDWKLKDRKFLRQHNTQAQAGYFIDRIFNKQDISYSAFHRNFIHDILQTKHTDINRTYHYIEDGIFQIGYFIDSILQGQDISQKIKEI